jgi:hypothetical protein
LGPIHGAAASLPLPLCGCSKGCYNVQLAIHGLSWVMLWLVWSSLGRKTSTLSSTGQLQEHEKPALGPIHSAAAPLHFLCVGPAKDVTMCNWQFMACLGSCCALFGAALGEKRAHCPRQDSYRSMKNQLWVPFIVLLHHSTSSVWPAKDVSMCNWQFMACLESCCALFGAAFGEK